MKRDEAHELKGTIKSKRSCIRDVVGAYVNSDGSVRATFVQDWEMLGPEAQSKVASLLKKAIGDGADYGTARFPRSRAESHALLNMLRDQKLADEDTLNTFITNVASSYDSKGKDYMIVMAYNAYDMPEDHDGDTEGQSTDVFRYIVGAICPTKLGDVTVSYSTQENKFKAFSIGSPVKAPIAGFLYPSFDGRATNTDAALVFLKDRSQTRFIRDVFGVEKIDFPAPAVPEDKAKDAIEDAFTGEDGDAEQSDSGGITIHVPKQLKNAVVEQTVDGEKCIVIRVTDVEKIV